MSVGTSDPLIGRLVDGRYQVRSRIARGGMATVYLATDLRLERRVAIKVMHSHLADDTQFRERFIQEARSAARLAHPNVVNVFDQGEDADSAYLVMEYLSGITLRDLLEEYGSLTPEQTIDIAVAVLSGLAAAHKAGIVHRDVKPENVLLADDGRIKLGDFGLARAASANTATGQALLGTIAYLSPELVTRGVADARSDVYAVGIMMYEMLTGEQPFTGEQPMQIAYQHATESVPAPSTVKRDVPSELDEIVLWATDRDPARRPADARAMLEQVRGAESSAAPPTTLRRLPTGTAVLPAARGSRLGPAGAPDDTTVLGDDVAPDRARADAETDILDGRRGGLVPVPPGPPGDEERPRRRRWIPVTVIGLVLAVAAAAGWWFLLGPGARVTIPDAVAGMTVEEARATLEDLGFVVPEQTGQTDSPTVPVGDVAQTDPAIGEAVEKGATVTLLVSTGPRPYAIAFTRGMPQAQAEEMVAEHFTLEDIDIRFDGEIPAGQLLDALDADGETLIGVAEYGDQQPITLVVSAGPLPAVAGLTVEQASSALDAVDLRARTGEEVFHNDIPAGHVVRIQTTDPDGSAIVIRPGDTVSLSISKGPDLVQIPGDIEDLTLADAKAALEALEFVVDVQTNIPGVFWDLPASEVDAATPGPGEFALRGSTVTIEATA